MTLQELIDKLTKLTENHHKINKNNVDKINNYYDWMGSEVCFVAEDDYNTFDVEIKNVEVEGNKIFLS